MDFLANSYSVYIFFLSASVFGWVISFYNQKIVKKIQPTTFILFTTFMSLIAILCLSFSSKKNPIAELSNLNAKEFIVLSLSAIFLVLIRLCSSVLLLHHNVETIQIASYIMAMGVNGLAVYLIGSKKLTISRLIAFIVMGAGGYIFTN